MRLIRHEDIPRSARIKAALAAITESLRHQRKTLAGTTGS
jgi:hypothetical protein